MSQEYREGSFFSVPLRHGGYCAGLLARRPRRGTIVLGYFFGPRRHSSDLHEGLDILRPEHAQLVCRFKDTGLHRGMWRVVGMAPHWNRELWPIPPFLRKEGLSGRGVRVEYDDENLTVPTHETTAGATDAHLGEDAVYEEERLVEVLERVVEEHKFTTTVDPSQWAG